MLCGQIAWYVGGSHIVHTFQNHILRVLEWNASRIPCASSGMCMLQPPHATSYHLLCNAFFPTAALDAYTPRSWRKLHHEWWFQEGFETLLKPTGNQAFRQNCPFLTMSVPCGHANLNSFLHPTAAILLSAITIIKFSSYLLSLCKHTYKNICIHM